MSDLRSGVEVEMAVPGLPFINDSHYGFCGRKATH